MLIPPEEFELVLKQIASAFEHRIRPHLHGAGVNEDADHIMRLLAMLSVTIGRSADLERDYRHAANEALTSLRGTSGMADAEPGAEDHFTSLRTRLQQFMSSLPVGQEARAGERELVRRLVDAEVRLQEDIATQREQIREGLRGDCAVAAESDDVEITPALLTDYLRTHVPGADHAHVIGTSLIAGGRSKQTIMVQVEGASSLPDRFILRKDRNRAIVDSTTSDEYDILSVVADTGGIPIPSPLWVEHDPAPLGGTCMAVSLLPGALEGEYHLDVRKPSANHRSLALQMARTLARIHGIPTARFAHTKLSAAPDLKHRLAARRDAIAGQFASASGQPSVIAAIAAQWLDDHADWGLIAHPRFIHGDFGLHNLLIEEGRITGVLDWEFASIASPANDIAMCYRLTSHLDVSWADFVDAYLAAGGAAEACDPRCVAFYRVLGLVSGTVRSRYGGHLFRTGQRRDLIVANSGYDYHFRSSRLLAEALRDALAIG